MQNKKNKKEAEEGESQMSQADEENDLSVRSLSFSLSPLSTPPLCKMRVRE